MLIGLIYAFFFAKKRIEQKKKKLPPFERAIEELKALESIKPTDQEEHKNYYSRLTDVIRRYLEEEAKISALESTSDELLSKLELLKDSGKLKLEHDTIKNLKSVLQTADLVKFAKSQYPIKEFLHATEFWLRRWSLKPKRHFPNPPQRK